MYQPILKQTSEKLMYTVKLMNEYVHGPYGYMKTKELKPIAL